MSGHQHWAMQYLGLPWINGERDCFQFFRQIQASHYGREIPAYYVDASLVLNCVRALRENPERQHWAEVSLPKDGDAVLMSQSRVPTHVGVWIDDGGGILHCVQGAGVVFSMPKHLASMGFKITGYYRWEGQSA